MFLNYNHYVSLIVLMLVHLINFVHAITQKYMLEVYHFNIYYLIGEALKILTFIFFMFTAKPLSVTEITLPPHLGQTLLD